jgi:membrane protease YdiL (CAAX protease family)
MRPFLFIFLFCFSARLFVGIFEEVQIPITTGVASFWNCLGSVAKPYVGRRRSPAMEIKRPSREVQLIELGVFLLLIVPSMAASFFILGQERVRFMAEAILSIFNDLALLSLVFYFIWRNGEPIQQVGWTFNSIRKEIAWGLILFVPVYFGANLLQNALHTAGLSAPAKLPSFLIVRGIINMLLAFSLVTVVAVAEETIFRGYLILRFRAVTGRTSAAALLSSIVFSLGHGYEGMAGVISVFSLGVVFALVYLWRKSLVAPIVMHFLTDFVTIILPTLLETR